MRPARAAPLALVLVAVGCRGGLAPAGPEAEGIAELFWLSLILAGVVGVLVLGVLARGVVRRRQLDDEDRLQRRFIVLGGIALPVVVLGALMVVNVATLARGSDPGPTEIEVVGHRYWWEVAYPDFETANEIHIPVGEPVELTLESEDVIHSVWVPELAGKVDMVPGRTNRLTLEADEAGTYVGRCAEYCGLQHTWMQFTVIAHEPDDYQRWYDDASQDRAEPTSATARDGREVFLASSCVGCHTIRGVSESGEIAPDLTNLAEREEIGAGIAENTDEHVRAFIANAQTIKPGAQMPPQSLSDDELDALVAYLREDG